ncbi:MAG: hypothetical protein QOE17_1613 [Gaiellales bacterium]|jgi:hypothetical protein|nr:hypothetical protein [Gaiellales bacterium]
MRSSHEAIERAETFSVDELTALAGLLGAQRFPGVPDGIYAQMAPEARQAVLLTARRSLVARGVIEVDGERGAVLAESHAPLLRTAVSAPLVVAVQRRDSEAARTRVYAAAPELTVEHAAVYGNVHRLAALDTSRLLERIVEFTGLDRVQGGSGGGSFVTSAEAYSSVREGVARGDLERARDALGEAGAEFALALEQFEAWCNVRAVHREGARVEIAETTWIATGGGLWQVESEQRLQPPGADPASVQVTISGSDIGAVLDAVIADLSPA